MFKKLEKLGEQKALSVTLLRISRRTSFHPQVLSDLDWRFGSLRYHLISWLQTHKELVLDMPDSKFPIQILKRLNLGEYKLSGTEKIPLCSLRTFVWKYHFVSVLQSSVEFEAHFLGGWRHFSHRQRELFDGKLAAKIFSKVLLLDISCGTLQFKRYDPKVSKKQHLTHRSPTPVSKSLW